MEDNQKFREEIHSFNERIARRRRIERETEVQRERSLINPNLIKRDGVNRVGVRFPQKNHIIFDDKAIDGYQQLLANKVIGEDRKLVEDIMEFRQQILQRRIYCHTKLVANGEVVASLVIQHILIEHGQEVVNYWIGVKIDKSTFEQQVKQFEYSISSLGAGKVVITDYNQQSATIDDVHTEFSFA